MTQTEETELRAEAGRIAEARRDAIFDTHREQTVAAAIGDSLDLYGTTEDRARALCFGWVESAAARCDWDTVTLVLAAFRQRFPA